MNFVTRTAIFICTACLIMLALIGGTAFVMMRDQLIEAAVAEAQNLSTLHAVRIGDTLAALEKQARALAQNPVIRTALFDSEGHTAYVRPFLLSAARSQEIGSTINLLDAQGRSILNTDDLADAGRRIQPLVAAVLADGEPGIQAVRKSGGATTPGRYAPVGRVDIVHPILQPETGTVEGALAIRIPVQSLLGHLAITGALYTNGPGTAVPTAAQARQAQNRVTSIPLADGPSGDRFFFAEPVDRSGIDRALADFTARALLIAALFIALTLVFGVVAARRITRPLKDMAALATRIASTDSYDENLSIPVIGSGEIAALSASFNDMLHRLRASVETDRDNHSRRYRQVFEAVGEGLITIAADGRMESVNSTAARLFGHSVEELVGQPVDRILPDCFSSAHDCPDGPQAQHGAAESQEAVRETFGLRKDGTEVRVELSISETRVDGEAIFIGVLRDISERKAAETALRMAEAEARKLALVAARTDNLVLILDTDGRIEWVNDAFERVSGYSIDEALGKRPRDILQGPHTDKAAAARIRHAVINGQAIRSELVNSRKNGDAYWIELEIQPVHDTNGVLTNFIAIEVDITERKKAHAELKRAKEEAEAASRVKSEFLSIVSHELRTPMTSINGALGLLGSAVTGDLSPAAQRLVELARQNGDRLLALINDILDIEKIESGKMVFLMEEIELGALIGESINQNQQYGQHRNVRIVATGMASDAKVRGDRQRLLQVLANVLSNAIKFSPDAATVTVSLAETDRGYRIAVTDQGSGIPESFRDRIFEKFSQADSSDKRAQNGTGLGLAITRSIIEEHDGAIHFDSEAGKGTTFFIDLPAPVVAPRDVDLPQLERVT